MAQNPSEKLFPLSPEIQTSAYATQPEFAFLQLLQSYLGKNPTDLSLSQAHTSHVREVFPDFSIKALENLLHVDELRQFVEETTHQMVLETVEANEVDPDHYIARLSDSQEMQRRAFFRLPFRERWNILRHNRWPNLRDSYADRDEQYPIQSKGNDWERKGIMNLRFREKHNSEFTAHAQYTLGQNEQQTPEGKVKNVVVASYTLTPDKTDIMLDYIQVKENEGKNNTSITGVNISIETVGARIHLSGEDFSDSFARDLTFDAKGRYYPERRGRYPRDPFDNYR